MYFCFLKLKVNLNICLTRINKTLSCSSAFVPLDIPNKKNSTEWEKVKLLFEEFGSSRKSEMICFELCFTCYQLILECSPLTEQKSNFSDGDYFLI